MTSSCASLVPLSSRSTTSQRASAPVTSRAIRNARTTSAGSAPRSAISWDMKVGPSALTIAFALTMQMSCLRSGCSGRNAPKRLTTGAGKYTRRSRSSHGSSTKSDRSSARASSCLE